jgi:hypothetical protein
MNSLIVKLGAAGDVVRTTPLRKHLSGQINWLVDAKNTVLLNGLADNLQCFSWKQRDLVPDITYDLIINLEEILEVGIYLKTLKCKKWFGAYADSANELHYTANSRRWFDLSLISSYGRQHADRLKLLNRRSYQDLIFDGLGWRLLVTHTAAGTDRHRVIGRCCDSRGGWADLADEAVGWFRRT